MVYNLEIFQKIQEMGCEFHFLPGVPETHVTPLDSLAQAHFFLPQSNQRTNVTTPLTSLGKGCSSPLQIFIYVHFGHNHQNVNNPFYILYC